jgi:hypothetical protein
MKFDIVLYLALIVGNPSSQRISGGMKMTIEDTEIDGIVTASVYCN